MTSLYATAVGSAQHALDRADHLLDCIAWSGNEAALLAARLSPGMMSAGEQLRTTAGFALRATFPLAGRELSLEPFAVDFSGLRAAIAFARAEISALSLTSFDGAESRRISHVAGEARLDQDGTSYLTHFALPNLWFHLSMAYAILRHEGLPIGKADFDGLHRYATGRTP